MTLFIKHNFFILFMVSFIVAGCSSAPPMIDLSPEADITYDGLHEVKNTSVSKAWAKPGASLAGYSKIHLKGIGVAYREDVQDRNRRVHNSGKGYSLTAKNKADFKRVIREAFLGELAESEHFTITEESGFDVLLVNVGLLDVVSYVPPERAGRNSIYLREIGAATLVLELRDSLTESIFLRVADRRAAEQSGIIFESNRVTNVAEIRRLGKAWGRLVRMRLEERMNQTE
ncbi:DUF3313 family protein [Thalassotalea sp. ND16A]|uniref:DUF3313 family protein n=1 Tax=Thalassotalea sp. ND16A TaxID=1535422 RepID=UPI00051A59A2|nr:DUF3313 family protein [Thalassotalea sp. ND16A]KGJ95837.1 hypothetical protein ND16A_1372 [Thalassotalea sp. ND16A]